MYHFFQKIWELKFNPYHCSRSITILMMQVFSRITVWFVAWVVCCGLLSSCGETAHEQGVVFPKISEPVRLTDGPEDHFYASYFGINSWSKSERYATVLQTTLKDTLPAGKIPATLGMVDMETREFIPLAETRAWNFQEGCMAHWLGWSPDSVIIYNDIREGRTVSVILNVHTREEIRVLPYPVSAVSPDGEYAISINFSRISITRPDYGYGLEGQDTRTDEMYPADDGLFLCNLRTGESKLLVAVRDVLDEIPEIKDPAGLEYFCHTLFSRDGSKVSWFARAIPERNTTAFTVDVKTGKFTRSFPDGWDGSHYDWLDGDRLMMTAKYDAKEYSHVLFTVGQQDYTRLGGGMFDYDGHATFSPDGKWMITDSYPSPALYEQRLALLDMESGAILPLGRFVHDQSYETYQRWTRCDLHCRWSPSGKLIGFNSTHEGSRQAYFLKVD